MWGSLLAVCALLAAPRVVRGLRTGVTFAGLGGVRVAALYAPLPSEAEKEEFDKSTLRSSTQSTLVVGGNMPAARMHWMYTAARLLSSFALWRIPGIDLNLGQSGSYGCPPC